MDPLMHNRHQTTDAVEDAAIRFAGAGVLRIPADGDDYTYPLQREEVRIVRAIDLRTADEAMQAQIDDIKRRLAHVEKFTGAA